MAAIRGRCALGAVAALFLAACTTVSPASSPADPADTILLNARIYTLGWEHPEREGNPAADAPWNAAGGTARCRGGCLG